MDKIHLIIIAYFFYFCYNKNGREEALTKDLELELTLPVIFEIKNEK